MKIYSCIYIYIQVYLGLSPLAGTANISRLKKMLYRYTHKFQQYNILIFINVILHIYFRTILPLDCLPHRSVIYTNYCCSSFLLVWTNIYIYKYKIKIPFTHWSLYLKNYASYGLEIWSGFSLCNKKGFFENRIFKGQNSFGLDAYVFQFLVT
jgi:hypothetical protein